MKKNNCLRFIDYSIICPESDSLFYGLAERMSVTSPLPAIRRKDRIFFDYVEPAGGKHGSYEFIRAEKR